MRRLIQKISVILFVVVVGVFFVASSNAYADEAEESSAITATSISISPVSNILRLEPNTTYDYTFTISNNGNSEMKFEVYAAPYAYIYSEEEDAYKLGFNKESVFTQISRWITFKDADGSYKETATFTAGANSGVEVAYRISTPESVPAGGQYAVIFAHTLSSETSASGIKTEASPGLVVYGRSDGDTVVGYEISNATIKQSMMVDGSEKSIINATAKVRNTGNVDFMASGVLKVTGIFGNTYYETQRDSTRSRISIIPDSELSVTESWDATPFFGMFNVEWTVYANGEASDTITKFVMIMPPVLIIFVILLLTIIIVWIIIVVRKRKERRAKFMV